MRHDSATMPAKRNVPFKCLTRTELSTRPDKKQQRDSMSCQTVPKELSQGSGQPVQHGFAWKPTLAGLASSAFRGLVTLLSSAFVIHAAQTPELEPGRIKSLLWPVGDPRQRISLCPTREVYAAPLASPGFKRDLVKPNNRANANRDLHDATMFARHTETNRTRNTCLLSSRFIRHVTPLHVYGSCNEHLTDRRSTRSAWGGSS